MRIQHNIMAMNAYRNLGMNNRSLSGNLEKLSSGYKINRAGDDAAGLAISEKMRAQITGLDAAQKNVNDGISLVKTAEGAMQEIQDMLNRMEYLATQSANGTYDNEVDRNNLQKEVNALKTEINRIADSANFNGINLLDGSLEAGKATAADPTLDPNAPKAAVATGDLGVKQNAAVKHSYQTGAVTAASAAGGKFTVTYMDADGSTKSVDIDVASGDSAAAIAKKIGADETLSKLFEVTVDTNDIKFEAKEYGASQAYVTGVSVSGGGNLAVAAQDASATDNVTGKDASIYIQKDETNGFTAGTGTDIKDKATMTIGDKTYEFLSDVSKVKEGNVAVQLGATDGVSMENLVKALKQNGVESARLVTVADGKDATNATATGIAIDDLSEISAAQQSNVYVESDMANLAVENTVDTAGKYTFTVAAGTDGETYTATFEYLDENGDKQSIDINYKAGADQNATIDNLNKALKDSALAEQFEITVGDGTNGVATGEIELTAKTAGTDGARLIGVKDNQATSGLSDLKITEEAKDAGIEVNLLANPEKGDTVTIDGKTYQFVEQPSDVTDGNIAVMIDDTGATDADKAKITAKNLASAMVSNGIEAKYDSTTGAISIAYDAPTTQETVSGGLTLQIGDTAEEFNQMTVSIGNMHVDALGTTDEAGELTSTIADIDIGNQEGAAKAVDVIKNAINMVSSTRGDLGAIQNRLEHTSNNLAVMEENIQDAESSIRDTDIADEMMAYTKNNILIQSAQAMLAQANQVPQGVLQLMQ